MEHFKTIVLILNCVNQQACSDTLQTSMTVKPEVMIVSGSETVIEKKEYIISGSEIEIKNK